MLPGGDGERSRRPTGGRARGRPRVSCSHRRGVVEERARVDRAGLVLEREAEVADVVDDRAGGRLNGYGPKRSARNAQDLRLAGERARRDLAGAGRRRARDRPTIQSFGFGPELPAGAPGTVQPSSASPSRLEGRRARPLETDDVVDVDAAELGEESSLAEVSETSTDRPALRARGRRSTARSRRCGRWPPTTRRSFRASRSRPASVRGHGSGSRNGCSFSTPSTRSRSSGARGRPASGSVVQSLADPPVRASTKKKSALGLGVALDPERQLRAAARAR